MQLLLNSLDWYIVCVTHQIRLLSSNSIFGLPLATEAAVITHNGIDLPSQSLSLSFLTSFFYQLGALQCFAYKGTLHND